MAIGYRSCADASICADNQKVTIIDGTGAEWTLESNGAMPVNIQDQTSKTVHSYFLNTVNPVPYTLALDTVPNTYTITLNDATGLAADDQIALFQDTTMAASFFARIISVAGNAITVDTPMDVVFTTTLAVLFEVNKEMAVDGSTTNVLYSIINDASIELDITKIHLCMATDTPPHMDEFGDLTQLTNGLIIRKNNGDGTYEHLFNFKCNGEISMYGDLLQFLSEDKTADENGVSCAITFAGQDRYGVTKRLSSGQSLEVIVRDNLTGLTNLRISAMGHIVTD